jgi:hypothetical protein
VRKTFERIRREQQAQMQEEQVTQISAQGAIAVYTFGQSCIAAEFTGGTLREALLPRLANENDERWQRINLNLHLGEVVVEVKHGGHGKQADISADSKDSGLALYRKYSI